MKTQTHSTSVYDAKCCVFNCVWNIHKTETLSYPSAQRRGRSLVGFSVWKRNRKFKTEKKNIEFILGSTYVRVAFCLVN
jgi:hypothetical protein